MNKKFLPSVVGKEEKSEANLLRYHFSQVNKELIMKKKAAKKTKSKRAHKPRAKKKSSSKPRKKSGLTQMTYGLSEELQAIVGAKHLTRPQVVKKLWEYIKAKKCQDTKNRRMIVPDEKLSKVIGSRPVDMLKLATHLNKHIKK
jgi:chromatin remodeling complex protein RSC6